MKIINSLAVYMLIFSCLLSFFPGNTYAGGGHAHFGRNEFVNGGMTPHQIAQSLDDMKSQASYARELLDAGDWAKMEEVALSIHDISSWVSENASMNRARHTTLKRASKSISRAASKLKKSAIKGDAASAEKEVERIQKLLQVAL